MKYNLFFLILILVLNLTYSQEINSEKSVFWSKVQFGGGLNLGFGNDVTNLGISPSAIYNFNEKFSAGLGLSYLYVKDKRIDDALNIYGGSLITFYKPLEQMQLSAEFEENILNQSGFKSRNVEALYIGAGYSIGKNVTIGMRYDVLYDEDKSIYGSPFSPIVRIYF